MADKEENSSGNNHKKIKAPKPTDLGETLKKVIKRIKDQASDKLEK